MVILGVLLILALCIYGVWRLSARSPSRRYGGSGIWRLAGLIATVRIGAIWLGIFGLQRSDWVQVPAYLLLVAGLPDIYIVRAAQGDPVRLAIFASLVLAATSVAWSPAFLWFVRRLRTSGSGAS